MPGVLGLHEGHREPSGHESVLVDYLFNVHHDGTLTAQLTWTDRDSSPFLELYSAVDGQASGAPLPMAGEASPFRGDVYAHLQYVLRVQTLEWAQWEDVIQCDDDAPELGEGIKNSLPIWTRRSTGRLSAPGG